MEWVLQVVDEIDDVIGAVRLGWSGLHTETAVLLAGCVAAAFGAAYLVGHEAVAVFAMTAMVSIGAAIRSPIGTAKSALNDAL